MKTKLTKLTSVLLCLVLSVSLFGGLTVNGFDWSAVEDDSAEDIPLGSRHMNYYVLAEEIFEQSEHFDYFFMGIKYRARDELFIYKVHDDYTAEDFKNGEHNKKYAELCDTDGVIEVFTPVIYDEDPTTNRFMHPSGDLDGDEKVTAADALICLQYVVGKKTFPNAKAAFDADYDNWNFSHIDATDALAILQKAVGKK